MDALLNNRLVLRIKRLSGTSLEDRMRAQQRGSYQSLKSSRKGLRGEMAKSNVRLRKILE